MSSVDEVEIICEITFEEAYKKTFDRFVIVKLRLIRKENQLRKLLNKLEGISRQIELIEANNGIQFLSVHYVLAVIQRNNIIRDIFFVSKELYDLNLERSQLYQKL